MDFAKERNDFFQELSQVVEEYFLESTYPIILKEKTKQMIEHLMPDHAYSSLFFLVPKLAKMIKPDLPDEKIQTAKSLGWIFQMFQAYYVTIDDFVDEGDKRYGNVTWSKLHNHSKSVIVYDVSIVRALAFFMLKKKFSHDPSFYLQLLQLFLDSDNKASKAYRLETHLLIENFRNGTTPLTSYTMETYELMTYLKYGSVWFCLPWSLAMLTAGYDLEKDREMFENIEVIAGHFGNLFQVTDDYFDSFCTTPGFDTEDSDIRRGQFSWCLLTAKELCTSEDEVADLFNHYGVDNDETVNYIKSLYEKIGIHELLNSYRETACDNILQETDRLFGDFKEIQEMIKWLLKWGLKENLG